MNTQNYHIIHITIIYLTRMTQNKNESIDSVLQHGRVVDNNCCADSENGRELPLT